MLKNISIFFIDTLIIIATIAILLVLLSIIFVFLDIGIGYIVSWITPLSFNMAVTISAIGILAILTGYGLIKIAQYLSPERSEQYGSSIYIGRSRVRIKNPQKKKKRLN